MIGDVGAEASAQVAGETDFDRDLPLREFFDEIGIVESGEAVANALGAQVQRAPDGFRGAGFSSVRGKAQAVVGGPDVGVAEKLRRRFLLVASDADADDLAVVIADSKLEDFLRGLRTCLLYTSTG